MISSLSSFIQFFAALYVTMSIDSLFCKSFWTPNYYSQLNSCLNKVNIPRISINDLTQSAKEGCQEEDRRSRKRGVYMLFISIFLLIYIGFENYHPNAISSTDIEKFSYSFPLVSVLVFGFIVYIFDGILLNKWSKVILFATLTIVLFTIAQLFVSPLLLNKVVWWKSDIVLWITVIVLLFPIIWQLLRNYLLTQVHSRYVELEASKCYLEYDKARTYDGSESATAGLQGCYKDAFAKASVSHDADITVEGEIINILIDQIKPLTKIPSAIQLIIIGLRFLFHKQQDLPSTPVVESQRPNLLNESVNEMDSYIHEFKSSPNQDIDLFCANKGIDTTAFKKAYLDSIRRQQNEQM